MEQTPRDDALVIVAHELSNELNVLAIWGELLLRPDPHGDRQRLAAATIARSIEIARRLCDDLIAITVDAEPAFVPSRVDLRRIAVTTLDAVTAEARRRRVRIVRPANPVPVWVMGDGVRLAEVISNLLWNALAVTGAGDTISVEVVEREGQARLVVADTGTGISAAFLPRILETARESGSQRARGLGLYVVRRLVAMHRGRLEVESDGHGLGARFIVILPSAAVRDAA